MSIDVGKWLAQLPIAEGHLTQGILLTGTFLPSEPGQVHILVGALCLMFLREDIMDVEPAGDLEGAAPAAGLEGVAPDADRVRIAVRKGAPLLGARAKELCATATQRRPFALAVRPRVITHDPSPRFRELERQFLQRQSLVDA
jgi:alpha-beta hydrolase superfamily lysophospholipase